MSKRSRVAAFEERWGVGGEPGHAAHYRHSSPFAPEPEKVAVELSSDRPLFCSQLQFVSSGSGRTLRSRERAAALCCSDSLLNESVILFDNMIEALESSQLTIRKAHDRTAIRAAQFMISRWEGEEWGT